VWWPEHPGLCPCQVERDRRRCRTKKHRSLLRGQLSRRKNGDCGFIFDRDCTKLVRHGCWPRVCVAGEPSRKSEDAIDGGGHHRPVGILGRGGLFARAAGREAGRDSRRKRKRCCNGGSTEGALLSRRALIPGSGKGPPLAGGRSDLLQELPEARCLSSTGIATRCRGRRRSPGDRPLCFARRARRAAGNGGSRSIAATSGGAKPGRICSRVRGGAWFFSCVRGRPGC